MKTPEISPDLPPMPDGSTLESAWIREFQGGVTVCDAVETRQSNVYTIEKNGLKKLIYQSPWYQNGAYAGFIELSLEIPFELPHFVRG